MSADDQINSGLGELRDRVGNLERGLASNTAMTAAVKTDVTELLDILNTAKGGLKVLGGFGSVLKWSLGIAAAAATLWATFTGKIPHP